MQAQDVPPPEGIVDIKIVAMMSVPMVGWMPHFGCAFDALTPFKIPLKLAYGAWWDHGICCLMEEAVAAGADWILTLDYDSMFTAFHLDRLIGHIASDDKIDAIAALQCRRGTGEEMLLSTPAQPGEDGKVGILVGPEPLAVESCHFGMTMIRVSKLAALPKPWMKHVPDANGSYSSDSRVDPDLYFWKQWREAGNTIFVDMHCKIGHLQPMVSQFDADFNARHVHVTDWRKANAKGAA